ncbi:MAG: bifunctional diaminohydroxyphosphoribosylaminopyrimidine deaminase/5-amino-6-(5-phosphoribosylamino)uracil reductase RibD [Planctomycetaceae bacterium]|nr:bifunctional diaminohydroxyphosphoribosylaminopyrimidine deaminase/5-amino-6-(5-phosphoribosylamino)uracil reductase RibD [Planctomycetaceae bacterium]
MSISQAAAVDVMGWAIALAGRGEGWVEPNPMVGAVVVDDDWQRLGEGSHERFGGLHAEIVALQQAGERSRGATLFVTLEPCCHAGKTLPCVDAVLKAGVRRVVIGMQDPFPKVDGQGISRLREAGVEVLVGLLEPEVGRLNAPFCKLIETGLPWIHAKWAMTLDGRLASHSGHSQWISNLASRAVVHRLRGRMDAIVVGIGTALADDPLLTARPPGPRVATRVVLDSAARLPLESQLVKTARETPLLVVVGRDAAPERIAALEAAGVEVFSCRSGAACPPAPAAAADENRLRAGRPLLKELLLELGRRRLTNVLIEGGSRILGAAFDEGLIDEVHAFVAPKLLGGTHAVPVFSGAGLELVPELPSLDRPVVEVLDGDIYLRGILRHCGDRA